MISPNDFSTGLTIELEGDPYEILEFQHSKSGRGQAFVRTKLRNLKNKRVINKTFRAGDKIERAHIEERQVQYLYRDRGRYFFMDKETYEQTSLPEETVGEKNKFLKENMDLKLQLHARKVIGVMLPTFVELEVTETDPGVRGDTASGGSKPATLETGAVVQVPLFVERGDVIKVDTRSGEYVERV